MVKNEAEIVMVDRSRPYETLTELEKLAVDEYDGNLTQTISTLLYHTEGGLSPYVEGMTRQEALITFRLMKQGAIEYYTEDGYSVALDLEQTLQDINISEEDLTKAEKNPFVRVFWKRVAIMVAVTVGYFLITIPLSRILKSNVWSFIAWGLVFVLAHCALDALVKVFRFRKAKSLKTRRDEIMAAKAKKEQQATAESKPTKPSWICHSCGEENDGRVAYCIYCNTSKTWSLEQQKKEDTPKR